MNFDQLVIFDYSGTLSYEAVLFAQPKYLMKHLKESSLFDHGIDTLDLFWQEIVNATWEEGSTTNIGYVRLIVKRLRELSLPGKLQASHDASMAAYRFVHAYFTHSPPDSRWQPLLTKLVSHPRTGVVVATDHYAEATRYIAQFMEDLKIPAKPARELFTDPDIDAAVVANSADIGYPKADLRFWEILKAGLTLKDICRVLYVDDFGYNESEGDDYGSIAKVEARKEKTIAILRNVFPGEITALPFILRRDPSSSNQIDQAYEDLIDTTIQQIEEWLMKS